MPPQFSRFNTRVRLFAVDADAMDATPTTTAAAFAENSLFPEVNGAILHTIKLAEATDNPALAARLEHIK